MNVMFNCPEVHFSAPTCNLKTSRSIVTSQVYHNTGRNIKKDDIHNHYNDNLKNFAIPEQNCSNAQSRSYLLLKNALSNSSN